MASAAPPLFRPPPTFGLSLPSLAECQLCPLFGPFVLTLVSLSKCSSLLFFPICFWLFAKDVLSGMTVDALKAHLLSSAMVLAAVLSIMLSVLVFRTGVDATTRSDPLSSGRASRHTASLTRATQQNQAQLVTHPIGALFPYEDHRRNKLAPQAKACLFPDFSRLANVGGHHQSRRPRHKPRTGKGTGQQLQRRQMQLDSHGHNHETEERMRTGTGVSNVDNTEADNEVRPLSSLCVLNWLLPGRSALN